MASVGDLNGDGIGDFAMTQGGATSGVWVVYGPAKRVANYNFSSLPANQGYRIKTSMAPSRLLPVGDQNGDGLDDLYVASAGMNHVVFGVSNPAASLDFCDGVGTSATRCLAAATPVSSTSERLGLDLTWPDLLDASMLNAGDIDGDGAAELLAEAAAFGGSGIIWSLSVLKGGFDSLCPASGACNLDVSSLSAPNLIRFEAPEGRTVGGSFGAFSKIVGDTDGDGNGEIVTWFDTDGSVPTLVVVINDIDWQSDVSEIEIGGNAFGIPGPFDAASIKPKVVGDVNGDGKDDFAVTTASLLSGRNTTIWTGGAPQGSETIANPTAAYGYRYTNDVANWDIGLDDETVPVGDLNGDGAEEFVVGSPNTPANSLAGSGVARVFFGKTVAPSGPIPLGPSTPSSDVFAITGSAASARFGAGVAAVSGAKSLGQFVVSATGVASNTGQVDMINASSFAAKATTGATSDLGDTSATLNGFVKSGLEADARFEYGTSDSFGSVSSPQAIAGGESKSLSNELTNLSEDTSYHYRLVVENDLGVKSYGETRSFKTKAKEVDRCVADPKLPGCPDWNFCEANPTDPNCVSQARLSNLILGQKKIAVKRGKKGNAGVTVVNTGNKSAAGLTLCVTGPKKFVTLPKCKKVSDLSAGSSVSRSFTVKVKKNARKGKKLALKLTAKADGLEQKSAKLTVTVR